MEMKTAYWMRYKSKEGFKHVAVVAISLEEAFARLIEIGINNSDIDYRNREIKILI